MKLTTQLKKLEITAKMLQKATGVTLPNAYKWLKGTRTPNTINMKKIKNLIEKADVLHNNLDVLPSYKNATQQYNVADALVRLDRFKERVKAKSFWQRFLEWIK